MEEDKKQLLTLIDNLQTTVNIMGINLIEVQQKVVNLENKNNHLQVRMKKCMSNSLEVLQRLIELEEVNKK